MYRIHRDREGSIAFFDTSQNGRFNLTSTIGVGTCYLSLDPLGAYVETLGRILTRAASDIASRRLSRVTVNRDLALFDVSLSAARSAYRAEGLDLTATIASGTDYGTPQRLAQLINEDGYDGIIYKARHDPGNHHESIAFFGPAGPNQTSVAFSTCTTTTVPADLVEDAARTFGILVLPDPSI